MLILDADEILQHGLSIAGRESNRKKECTSTKKNQKCFKKLHGFESQIICAMWAELQTTDIKEAKITNVKMKDLNMFLLMCHHVKCYQVGEVQAKTFGVHENTASHWTRHYLKKLVALKKACIVWPDDFGDRKFILSLDCVNFGINEPRHLVLHKVKEFLDRKGGKAGLTCKIALDLWSSNIIWINGPFTAATGDCPTNLHARRVVR